MARYIYEHVIVRRVIDGDTILLDIDFGQDLWKTNQRIRLAHINAPEMPTDAGKAAALYLLSLIGTLNPPPALVLETLKDRQDPYGRYLGILWKDGVNLNEAMVQAGHAVPYPVPKEAV